MNRVAWDLRHANPRPVRPSSRSSAQGGRRGWNSSGPLVTPGVVLLIYIKKMMV